jgi:hypothetical protein
MSTTLAVLGFGQLGGDFLHQLLVIFRGGKRGAPTFKEAKLSL